MLTVEAEFSQVSGRLSRGEPGEQADRQPFWILHRVHARAHELVAAAVEAAKAAPPADEASAFTDVWADGGAEWRT